MNTKGRLTILRGTRTIIVLALAILFIATTSYSVMSDTSVHGLATKIIYANRYCTTNPSTPAKNVTFYLLASVWSASSLRTSISNIAFSLTVDGTSIGTTSAPNSAWDPGQYATFTLTFVDPTISPSSLPTASTIAIAVTAYAAAGIASASVTASHSIVQYFGNTSC